MTIKLSDMEIIIDSEVVPTDLYIITPASKEEIENGEYLEINGMKLSSNPRKHGILRIVKIGGKSNE